MDPMPSVADTVDARLEVGVVDTIKMEHAVAVATLLVLGIALWRWCCSNPPKTINIGGREVSWKEFAHLDRET